VAVEPGLESVSFPIPTSSVTANTAATVTATWGGASVQAPVTLTPQQAPASITLSRTTVVGLGGSSFATVRVATANSSDEILQVTSSNPAVARVSSSVMIPSGATAGGFNIFTSPVTTQTLVTISVSGGGVTKSATLTVNPQPPSLSTTLTVTATGRSGERIASSPAGISTAVGSTGSALLAGGTAITLSVSNGRDAIWSGACSSGGRKAKSCTFTLAGNASVTGNVQ
jgi:hypothetical protein